MAEKNQKKLTPFEQETIEVAKRVVEYKLNAEANVVSIFYKNPDELYNVNLSLDDFSNNIWRVYFQIAHDLILVEKKESLDDVTVGIYLEKHDKLRAKYDEYGGYETIQSNMKYVNVLNLNAYISELRKWKAVLQLCKRGFGVKDHLSEFVDLTAEQIYQRYEAFLNDVFANVDSDVKSYQLCDGIHELIETLNEDTAKGLDYYDMPLLTNETGGQYRGSITLLGGISNAGKSTIVRSTTLPSIIKANERVVVMVNEDSVAKWQREMLVWVANNVLHYDLQKHTVRDGNYIPEVKQKLHEAANWLEENTKNHAITIIPFQQYQTAKAIKQIKKYAALGVKYFILDTFKMDAGRVTDHSWMEMQQAMVDIKDTVKTEAANVHIIITFQLEKGSSVMRYYTQNNIGLAKNIVDVASTCIMVRDLFDDEYVDGKQAIKVYRSEGVNGRTKVEVKMDRNKKYQLFFIVKNQEGAANAYQIVVEHDKSRNIIKEVGTTNISPSGNII